MSSPPVTVTPAAGTSTASGATESGSHQIKKVDARKAASITRLVEPLDETNWNIWRERIRRVFKVCGVLPYIDDTIPCPNKETHPEDYHAWEFNDSYAQCLISNNITANQMINVSRLDTARQMWVSLQAVHASRGYQYAIAIERSLFSTRAEEGQDINEHLNKLKETWEKLNILNNPNFAISDIQFKTIIASSLPESWDVFTTPYVGGHVDETPGVTDTRQKVNTQEFIGIIKEEYIRRKERGNMTTHTNYQASSNSQFQQPLVNRLKDRIHQNDNDNNRCRNCNLIGHRTNDCKWLGQIRCRECNWFGHKAKDCRRKGKGKRKVEANNDTTRKKQKEQTHETHEESSSKIEELTFVVDEYDTENYNFDTYNSDVTTTEIDERLSYYDWLSDSATTSHITNSKDSFITYKPLDKIAVSGVRSLATFAEGKGTVELESTIDGNTYVLKLEDVLYIPSNNQNLISLGRWDKAGGHYSGGDGQIKLIAKNGKAVAQGHKIQTNLYKMNLHVRN